MIRIITDSVAGIPAELAKQEDIQVATLFVNRDGVEYEDATMDIDGFYEDIYEMIDDIPTSSQPSQGALTEAFAQAAEAGDEVLGIFVSGRFSGTVDGALRAARSVSANHADFRFCIIDALSIGFDEGFAVLAAAAARNAGCTLEQCQEQVVKTVPNSRILFTPESLRFLKAGGRIGEAAAFLGSMVKLCPLLTVRDGEVLVLGKVRTHRKAVAAIAERFAEDIRQYGFKSAVVQYIGNPKEAMAWAKEVIEPICQATVAVLPVSPVVGLHVGPALGLSYECGQPLPDKLSPGTQVPVYYS